MRHSLVFKALLILFYVFTSSNLKAQNNFIIDNIQYSYDINSSTASVIANNYSGNIIIPETVDYNGTQYSVISIKKSAFLNCSGLTTITILASLSSIGDSAFYGCTGLLSLTSYNPEPPSTGANAFDQIDFFNCEIFIKIGSLSKYLGELGWKQFSFIQETIPTGLSIPENKNVKVYTEADCAVIKGADWGEDIKVYTEHGMQIKSIKVQNELVKIKLSANQICIIQIGKTSYKVVPFI